MEAVRPLNSTFGFTLVEVAIVLVVLGLLIMSVAKGQELFQNARVHNILAQQAAVEQAVLAFEDRYRALPGDYAHASMSIWCGPSACLNGNGNGRVEPGTNGAVHEDILAWAHLSGAGFLRESFQMLDAGVSIPAPNNSPSNIYGGYLEVAFDSVWGYSTNPLIRHNLKTGNYVPAVVLSEVDLKIDDGLPGSGRFQFSVYAGAGSAPVAGAMGGCTAADSPTATWLSSSDNCGGATLLR